ncbi:hypothetical protein [Mycolicibacterium sp.]|uniref:hypothetical protein n=1 Tax=Mycolicibacterium sp. TaxID=2320850 RepID=UPI001A23252F|nr:hypothetical protein [Mycolicibacterium sp.]MBJ7338828.1 hypothetical protein [Mycolicibacterium sp.]
MNELPATSPGRATPAKKAPAKKAPAKKAPAKKAPAKKAPAKKAPAKKLAGKKAAAKKGAAKKSATKASGPQHNSDTKSHPALAAPPSDPLIVLGLHPRFTVVELRRAWREYAATHHPDVGGDPATFSRGRHAYDALRARRG